MLMASTVGAFIGPSENPIESGIFCAFYMGKFSFLCEKIGKNSVEISHHILIDSPEMAWEVCQFQCWTYAIVSASMLLMDHSSRFYWWIFFETF